jgi:hypothetical protein
MRTHRLGGLAIHRLLHGCEQVASIISRFYLSLGSIGLRAGEQVAGLCGVDVPIRPFYVVQEEPCSLSVCYSTLCQCCVNLAAVRVVSPYLALEVH